MMNINAVEFKPKSYHLPQVIIKTKPSLDSNGDPTSPNHPLKNEWVYWSKNLLTNIVVFFDIQERIIYRLLCTSTRMRGAVLCLVPRIKQETYKAAPERIQRAMDYHDEYF